MTTTNNTNNKLQNIYEEALKVNSKKASAIYQAGACGAITTEEVIKQLKQLQPEQEKKAEQKRQAEAQAAEKKCTEKAQRRAAKKAA